MSEFPRGSYRDWADEGSERSSYTDEAGYQSSNDGPRRSTAGSVASNDERRPLSHGIEGMDDKDETAGNVYSAASLGNDDVPADGQGLSETGTHLSTRHDETAVYAPSFGADAAELAVNAYQRRLQSGRSVDFATGAEQYSAARSAGAGDVETVLENERMGPPLSRALLIQSSGGEGSLKSYGSDDGQPMSNDIAGSSPFHSSTASNSSVIGETTDATSDVVRGRSKLASSHPTMGDDGSQAGIETDDCGCSLDVETHSVHSVGTRSVYSQEDASMLPRIDVATIHDVPAFEASRLRSMYDDLGNSAFSARQDDNASRGSRLDSPMNRYDDDDLELRPTPARSDERGRPTRGNLDHQYRFRNDTRRSRSRSPDSRAAEDDTAPASRKRDRDDDDDWDSRRRS